MRSLFARILIWFSATLAITIIGAILITELEINTSEHQPFYSRVTKFELKDARYAWESGGKAGLAEFMQRFRASFEGPGMLTDAQGKDLLTGRDWSDLVRHATDGDSYRVTEGGRAFTLRATGDGKYWFFHLVSRPGPAAWLLSPQLLWMMGAAVLFCWLLAYQLTKPLRNLEKTVARFGQGDFAARAS